MQHLENHSHSFTSPVTLFILGTLSMAGLTFFTAIPAILLGQRTLSAMKSGEYPDRNRPLAEAGVIMAWFGMLFGSVILMTILVYYASPSCAPPKV